MPVFVNVKDYGAKGDGTTDDHDAIQAAIDNLPTSGGTVYFPPGTYRITETIVLGDATTGTSPAPSTRNGMYLLGSGMGRDPMNMGGDTDDVEGATRLLYDPDDPDYTGNVIKFNGPIEGCGIENMVLDGNNKAGTLIHSQRSFHQYVGNVLGLRWRAPVDYRSYALLVHASNSYGGAGGGAATQHLYENVYFTDPCQQGGFASGVSIGGTVDGEHYGNCNQIVFVRCMFDRRNIDYSVGLHLGWCDHVELIGCHFIMTGASGSTGIGVLVEALPDLEGAPVNVSFFGTALSGGVSLEGDWANAYYPALIFHPYFTADGQPIPPRSANSETDLPPGLVYGMTDHQLALGYRFDQVCGAGVPSDEDTPIPASSITSHAIVLVHSGQANRIIKEMEVPRSVGSTGVFELTVFGSTDSYDGILFRPGGTFGKGFAIDADHEVVLNHYRAVKLVYCASLGYWFFPDSKIRHQ